MSHKLVLDEELECLQYDSRFFFAFPLEQLLVDLVLPVFESLQDLLRWVLCEV